jgi:hypothetical protein
MRDNRNKVWVDTFQTQLFRRIVMYLAVYVVCLVNILYICRLLAEGPGNPWQQFVGVINDYSPVLLSLVLILPVMAYDAVHFTHRLVGPLVRFRSVFRAVANGEQVRRIKLRQHDFLHEMAGEFNEVLEAVHRQGVPVLKPADGQDDSPQRQPA